MPMRKRGRPRLNTKRMSRGGSVLRGADDLRRQNSAGPGSNSSVNNINKKGNSRSSRSVQGSSGRRGMGTHTSGRYARKGGKVRGKKYHRGGQISSHRHPHGRRVVGMGNNNVLDHYDNGVWGHGAVPIDSPRGGQGVMPQQPGGSSVSYKKGGKIKSKKMKKGGKIRRTRRPRTK